MLAKLVRWTGIIAASLMVMSFVFFIHDEGSSASDRQVRVVDGADPSDSAERAREAAHSDVREKIDDANDFLAKPFAWATRDMNNLWIHRIVTVVLGLLLYGLGFAWLANLMPKARPTEPSVWRA